MSGVRPLVAVVMGALLVVSACGGTPGPTADGTPSPAQSGPAPSEADTASSSPSAVPTLPAISPDPNLSANLVIWGWESAIKTLKEVEPDFKKAYPNITVEYVVLPPADTYLNLQLAVSAGSGAPDISVIEDSHLAQFVDLGALSDITEQVTPYVPFMNAYKWQAAQLDGRYYALPWDSGPVAVYYRRDVFEKAGVDPATIQTWEDFYQAAKTIKAKTGVPMWQNSTARNSGRLFERLVWQRGLGYLDATGAVILDKDPKILEVLEYMGTFWKEGLSLDNEEWTDPWYGAFADGGVATEVSAAWMGGFLKGWIAPKAEGKWGAFKMPRWQPTDAQASNDGGSQLAIFKQSKQPEAAWAYVQFHLGRYESQLLMYQKQDFFPALEVTYEDPFYGEPDLYFGGDKVRTMFSEIVAEIPSAGMYSVDYQEMNALLMPEIQKFALGQQTAQDALVNAAKLIRDQTQRP